MIHELKTWSEYFDQVWSGRKTFELRKMDRDFQVGDTLVLKDYYPHSDKFSGHEVKATVTYILKGSENTISFGLPPGYCIMSLSNIEKKVA